MHMHHAPCTMHMHLMCMQVAYHIGLMAVCSAVGQLFIFYTIKTYGPLVFATIQTARARNRAPATARPQPRARNRALATTGVREAAAT